MFRVPEYSIFGPKYPEWNRHQHSWDEALMIIMILIQNGVKSYAKRSTRHAHVGGFMVTSLLHGMTILLNSLYDQMVSFTCLVYRSEQMVQSCMFHCFLFLFPWIIMFYKFFHFVKFHQ